MRLFTREKELTTVNERGLVPEHQTTNPANLVAIAVQQNADLAKIEKLMGLQERWEKNEARKAYVVAMNAFKKNPPALYKTKHVQYETSKGWVDYHHGDIGVIANVISEALAIHDLSYRWDQEQLDGGLIRVTCVVTHALGHSESNFLQSGADQSGGKNNIQAIGSAVKYLRRYTLEGAVGLATQDVDDDGRGASANPNTKPEPEQVLLPVYPEQLFTANFSAWAGLIKKGKPHANIINKLSTTYTLTDEQRKKIMEIK